MLEDISIPACTLLYTSDLSDARLKIGSQLLSLAELAEGIRNDYPLDNAFRIQKDESDMQKLYRTALIHASKYLNRLRFKMKDTLKDLDATQLAILQYAQDYRGPDSKLVCPSAPDHQWFSYESMEQEMDSNCLPYADLLALDTLVSNGWLRTREIQVAGRNGSSPMLLLQLNSEKLPLQLEEPPEPAAYQLWQLKYLRPDRRSRFLPEMLQGMASEEEQWDALQSAAKYTGEDVIPAGDSAAADDSFFSRFTGDVRRYVENFTDSLSTATQAVQEETSWESLSEISLIHALMEDENATFSLSDL